MKRLLLATSFIGALGCTPVACVSRGSRVRTPRGLRPIEDLREGDEVYAADPATGELVATKIVFTRSAHRECVSFGFDQTDLVLTSDHPLYDPDTKTWAPAGDWALGKRTRVLFEGKGGLTPTVLERTSTFVGIHEVFDLTVDHELHNFIANGVLVHNKSRILQCSVPGGTQLLIQGSTCQCGGGISGVVVCDDTTTSTVGACSCGNLPLDSGVTDAGVDAGIDAGQPRDCPRVELGSTLPATYSGDTTGLPNLVTSTRLEWTDAPDDALEFTAPSAGSYVIDLTSTVPNLGASAQDFKTTGTDAVPFTAANCPAPGAVVEINGIYNQNQPNYPITLTAGQKIVIFVSAPSWANLKVGPYTLTVRKL